MTPMHVRHYKILRDAGRLKEVSKTHIVCSICGWETNRSDLAGRVGTVCAREAAWVKTGETFDADAILNGLGWVFKPEDARALVERGE